jgi:Tripartite tricarboxylate transporter TctB family.
MQSTNSTELRRRGEVAAGLLLALLGSYIALESFSWEILGKAGPGPGFFPLIYGVLIFVLSLFLVLQSVRRGVIGEAEPANWRGVGVALVLWAIFACSVLVIKYLGFLIAVAFLMFTIARVVFSKSLPKAIAAALIAPPIFYAIFTLGLQVTLPVGSITGF